MIKITDLLIERVLRNFKYEIEIAIDGTLHAEKRKDDRTEYVSITTEEICEIVELGSKFILKELFLRDLQRGFAVIVFDEVSRLNVLVKPEVRFGTFYFVVVTVMIKNNFIPKYHEDKKTTVHTTHMPKSRVDLFIREADDVDEYYRNKPKGKK